MAKYGSFKYGSGTKYGTGDAVASPALTGAITWIFQVDWTNSGSFTGYNEAQNMKGLPSSVVRGRPYYIGYGGNGFEHFQEGRFSIALENTSGRYDPYTQATIRPGKKCQLAIMDNATQVTQVLMTGYIEEIRPTNDGSNTVIIDVVDGFHFLNGYEVSTAATKYRTNISTAINDVLTLAGWAGSKAIDDNTQPIVSFALDNDDAGSTLAELSNASLGNFFIDRHGKAIYYSRTHNSQTTHTLDQTQVLKEIPTSTPWENVRNAISVTAIKPFKGALQNILSISPIKINIPVNRTVTFELDGEWIDVIYEGINATTQPGSGIDITSAVVVSYSIGKKSATFTFDTSVGGYVNQIFLKGRQLEPKRITSRAADTTSRVNYGSRRFNLESEWLQNINHAESFASTILAALKDPSKAPKVTIEGRPDIQFSFELLDKVTFTSTALSIDETFYIGQIEYRVLDSGESSTCQKVQTILSLQPLIYDNTSIDDDPFDPGLPEVPTVENPGGSGIIPTPPEGTILDCISDPTAAQNGPYTLFDEQHIELLLNPTYQQKIDIPYQCVVRIASATHKTYITFEATRLRYDSGVWYPTDADNFYEVWAIDSTGAPLFQAETVVTSGNYIVATFSPTYPTAGTVVAGFRLLTKKVPESEFDIGYTFNFATGSNGWYPAPQNASYPNGNIYPGPYNAWPQWNTTNFRWTGGKLEIRSRADDDGGFYEDNVNSWVYKPSRTYIKAGATFVGTFYEELSFNGFGALLTDGSWRFGYGHTGTQTRTFGTGGEASDIGKQVAYFIFHATEDRNNWQTMDTAIFTGFSMESSTFKLIVRSASIANICAVT